MIKTAFILMALFSGLLLGAQTGGPFTVTEVRVTNLAETSSFGGAFSLSSQIHTAYSEVSAGGAFHLQGVLWQENAARTPNSPHLQVARMGELMEISWPAEQAGFTLESSEDLLRWTAVAGQIRSSGDFYTITLPLGNGQRFFRIKK